MLREGKERAACRLVNINICSGVWGEESCEGKPGKRSGKQKGGKEGKAKVRSSARAEGVQMAAVNER